MHHIPIQSTLLSSNFLDGGSDPSTCLAYSSRAPAYGSYQVPRRVDGALHPAGRFPLVPPSTGRTRPRYMKLASVLLFAYTAVAQDFSKIESELLRQTA